MQRRCSSAALGLAVFLLTVGFWHDKAPARDNQEQATLQTALFLMQNSQRPARDGRHHLLLRSLRQLRDPQLHRLFEHLLDTQIPSLQIHGFLGMVESTSQDQADLSRLAHVRDERLAAEMINAALDNDLLSAEQARQILSWSEFDPAARLLVACRLVELGQFDQPQLLAELARHQALAIRSLAGLLLLQTGDPQGTVLLESLNQSEDPRRDSLRETLCRTALRQQFDRAGAWGMQIATEPGVSSRTGLAGLQVAMRFGTPGADDFWQRSFTSSQDPAQQMRLALLAIELSPWISAEVFSVLILHEDAVIAQVGRAGQAVTQAREDLPQQLGALVRLQHPLASDWAIRYARRHAPLQAVRPIVAAVLQAYEGPARHQAQRFEDVVAAVQVLVERDPTAAGELLRERLSDARAAKQLQQAILLGLIRSRPPGDFNPASILEGLPDFGHPDVASLALLLEVKNHRTLTQAQLESLGLIVRGGGDVPETLRLQAAWLWLKHTGQASALMPRLLAGP